MIALLHYALLKGVRDRSLLTFAAIPAANISAVLIAMAVHQKQMVYPLTGVTLDHVDLAVFSILIPSFIATLSAFWTFRSEVATKAIASFVVATRPLVVVTALLITGVATAAVGTIGMLAAIFVLTARFPAEVLTLIVTASIASMVGAAMGTLYVNISAKPEMFVWALLAGIPVAPFIFNPKNQSMLPFVALAVTVVAISVSAFLLRRRCAT